MVERRFHIAKIYGSTPQRGTIMGIEAIRVYCHVAGKRRFPDELMARMATRQHISSHRQTPAKLWVYYCRDCDGWHMTRRDIGFKWLVTKDKSFHDRNLDN